MKINLNIAPTEIDPNPSTVQGVYSLIERFYAFKRVAEGDNRAWMQPGPIDQVAEREPNTSLSASTVPVELDLDRVPPCR